MNFRLSYMRIAVLFSLSILIFGGGCTTIAELPAEQRDREPDDAEYRIGREMLICFIKNDAAGFRRHLSAEGRLAFDDKKFTETRKAVTAGVGEPVSFRYLTSLEFVALKPHIWKVRFRRTDAKNTREYFSEALFRIITGRVGDEIRVLSFNFL